MTHEVVFKGKWLEFRKEGTYEFFHRHNKPNAVVIFATTENRELIAVEQVRLPHGKPVLEAPAGLIDPGETYLQAAYREMMEETGYGEGFLIKTIENVTSSPGICTEQLQIVVMGGMKKIGEGGGLASENENIKIHLIPIDDIDCYLKNISNKVLLDMKLLASLHYIKG